MKFDRKHVDVIGSLGIYNITRIGYYKKYLLSVNIFFY